MNDQTGASCKDTVSTANGGPRLNLWITEDVESLCPKDSRGGRILPPPTYRTSDTIVTKWYRLSVEEQKHKCNEWHKKNMAEKNRAHKEIQGERIEILTNGKKRRRRIQVWKDRSKPKTNPASQLVKPKEIQHEESNHHPERGRASPPVTTTHNTQDDPFTVPDTTNERLGPPWSNHAQSLIFAEVADSQPEKTSETDPPMDAAPHQQQEIAQALMSLRNNEVNPAEDKADSQQTVPTIFPLRSQMNKPFNDTEPHQQTNEGLTATTLSSSCDHGKNDTSMKVGGPERTRVGKEIPHLQHFSYTKHNLTLRFYPLEEMPQH